MNIRRIPITVRPLDGEALDSWIEFYAHQTHTAWADMLVALGLPQFKRQAGVSPWLVLPSQTERDGISAATGVERELIIKMTLAYYEDRALRIDARRRILDPSFPWSPRTVSRYCPECLMADGGRWQLSWRLGWSFACLRHSCLLADACPECQAAQRRRPHVGELIPQPGKCAAVEPLRTGRTPARCGADLTNAPVLKLDDGHPAISAQQVVNQVIQCDEAVFGVYSARPQPRLNVLADIRALAGRILSYATRQELDAVVPANLLSACDSAASRFAQGVAAGQTNGIPGRFAPATAAVAAVGVVSALRYLNEDNAQTAHENLRWLFEGMRQRGVSVVATNMSWSKWTSKTSTSIQLGVLTPSLKPTDVLRYQATSAWPSHPTKDYDQVARLIRRLPAMLWPAWSLPFSIPGCHQRQLRPALSIAIAVCGNRRRLDVTAKALRSPISGHSASRVIQMLNRRDEWPEIAAALCMLAEHLNQINVPIDYERRRLLDYSSLLPDAQWTQICRDTATPGGRPARAKVARLFLFERITGSAAEPRHLDNALRSKVADFPYSLTPELAEALDEHARNFLARVGIVDEPVQFEPSADLLVGVKLPARQPDTAKLEHLHELVRTGWDLGAAAGASDISLEAARYLLSHEPAPAIGTADPSNFSRYGAAYRSAKQSLSKERFADLYETEGLSLAEIAADNGVNRQTLTRIAEDYGLQLRLPGRRSSHSIDGDWLYDQYVNEGRTLPDLAREYGVYTATMARGQKCTASRCGRAEDLDAATKPPQVKQPRCSARKQVSGPIVQGISSAPSSPREHAGEVFLGADFSGNEIAERSHRLLSGHRSLDGAVYHRVPYHPALLWR
jgi:TniQ